jgi:hypothetical protein
MDAINAIDGAFSPNFATDVLVDLPGFGYCLQSEVHDMWLVAQIEVEIAYRAWSAAEVEDRVDRFRVYRAALEREERAASMLAMALRLPPVGG